MGKQNKTSFKKGNRVGKLGGRPKGGHSYTKEERQARKIHKEIIFRYLNQHLLSTKCELEKRLKSPKVTILEAIIIKVLLVTHANPTVGGLEFILDRTIGKVKKATKHTIENEYQNLSDAELVRLHNEVKKMTHPHLRFIETVTSH